MVNEDFNQFQKDRLLLDKVLGKETSQEFENELINKIGYKDYFAIPKELRPTFHKLYSYMREREIILIERTIKEMKKQE